jgi:hypothetical protein
MTACLKLQANEKEIDGILPWGILHANYSENINWGEIDNGSNRHDTGNGISR